MGSAVNKYVLNSHLRVVHGLGPRARSILIAIIVTSGTYIFKKNGHRDVYQLLTESGRRAPIETESAFTHEGLSRHGILSDLKRSFGKSDKHHGR